MECSQNVYTRDISDEGYERHSDMSERGKEERYNNDKLLPKLIKKLKWLFWLGQKAVWKETDQQLLLWI